MVRNSDPELLAAWRLHAEGKNEEAIERFNRILSQQPDNADALNGLGLAQKALGDNLGAKVTFKKLIEVLEKQAASEPANSVRASMEVRMIRQQLEMLSQQ